MLLPTEADRALRQPRTGHRRERDQPPLMVGDGSPSGGWMCRRRPAYRVHLRYAASAPRPCDIVIDGDDLNDYNMCARNTTGPEHRPRRLLGVPGHREAQPPALHWLRLQDVLPDIVALRLEPVDRDATQPDAARCRWQRYAGPVTRRAAPEADAWKIQPSRQGHGRWRGRAMADRPGRFTRRLRQHRPRERLRRRLRALRRAR